MKDYSDLGLNDKLQAIEGIAGKARDFQDALSIEGKTDRGGITTAKMQNESVTSTKLGTGAVGTAVLADNSVTSAKIVAVAVTNPKIGNEAVNTEEIASGAITAVKIGGSVIAGTHIGTNVIINSHISSYDFAKGTGNLDTAGSIETGIQYSVNGTIGIGTTFSILDRNGTIGTITHAMTFTGGLLTSYGTS